MRNNESIADSFAKIAQEQGLFDPTIVKKAEETTKELSNIELLYGLKPKDWKDILDEAHKESVVISPAYNEVDGLVENLKQRHKIMEDIANRKPAGNYKQYFYTTEAEKVSKAYNDLLHETIKIAYQLDLNNEDELAVLADSCSQQLTKQAIGPLAVVGIVAAVSALGYLVYSTNNPSSQGVRSDTKRALAEIEEIRADYPDVAKNLQSLKENLDLLSSKAELFASYNDKIINSLLTISGSSKEEKKKAVADNANKFIGKGGNEIISNFEDFKEECKIVSGMIPIAISYLNRAKEQAEESSNNTWYQVKKFFQSYIYNSNFEDLIKVLGNLQESMAKVPGDIDQQIAKLKEIQGMTAQPISETRT
jgi:cell division septum initiation protein DivIVA